MSSPFLPVQTGHTPNFNPGFIQMLNELSQVLNPNSRRGSALTAPGNNKVQIRSMQEAPPLLCSQVKGMLVLYIFRSITTHSIPGSVWLSVWLSPGFHLKNKSNGLGWEPQMAKVMERLCSMPVVWPVHSKPMQPSPLHNHSLTHPIYTHY